MTAWSSLVRAAARAMFPDVCRVGHDCWRGHRQGRGRDRFAQQVPPVVVGGADTQLGLIGIGVTEPGRFTVVGGSFWQATAGDPMSLSSNSEALLPNALPHRAGALDDRRGLGSTAGLVMRWFRDAFCELRAQQAQALVRPDVYDLLERRAAPIPPGANGVFGIFSNLMQANRWVHASPVVYRLRYLAIPPSVRQRERASFLIRGRCR